MTKLSRKLKTILATGMVVSFMSACSGGAGVEADDTEPRAGGDLTVGVGLPWATDPNRVTNVYSSWSTAQLLFDRLFHTDNDGNVEPGLADSYEIDGDGSHYTVTLREGLTFHDGTVLDAEAVKTSIEYLLDTETASTLRSYWEDVESIEVIDELNVAFQLSAPSSAFVRLALAGPGSGIVSPTALEKHGDDFARNPVGAGPFQFVSENPGSELTLAKFEDYYDPERPLLDTVTISMIPDGQTRFQSLQSGAIDLAAGLEPRSVVEAEGNTSFTLSNTPGYGNNNVSLNMTKAPFDDVRAREAVCRAIDAEAINEAANLGVHNTDINSPFGPEHPFAPGETLDGAMSYDQQRAQELVDEMGGLEFELTFSQAQQPTADALVAQWDEVGIEVVSKPVEASVIGPTTLGLEHDAAVYRYQGDTEPDRNVAAFFTSDGAHNTSGISDSELDALIQDGREEQDEAERQETYNAISERLAELMPVCWTYSNDLPFAYTTELQGIPESPFGIFNLRDAYLTE